MMKLYFNYDSERSKKARLSIAMNGILIIFVYIIAITMLAAGFVLVMSNNSAGWLSIGFVAFPVILIEWYSGDLKKLRAAKRPVSIDGLLSRDILGQLPRDPNPRDLTILVSNTFGGRFFNNRFGISPRFLYDMASADPNDMKAVWEESFAIYNKIQANEITSAIILVAIIKTAPNYLAPLNHLQLDIDDLESGIDWYNEIINLISKPTGHIKTGGLARDWSFGWTPILDKFGINISNHISRYGLSSVKLEAHNDVIDKMINVFSKKGRQNIVLVGPDGVGKTEIIKAFASKLMNGENEIDSSLQYRQVFMLDAATIISMSKNSSVENVVNQILNEAYSAKSVIICLDNAHLFLEDGVGSIDITNILIPIIESGVIRLILAMSDQQLLKIKTRNPELANILNITMINSPNDAEIMKIMQNRLIAIESQNHVTFMYQAIIEAYKLSKRYIYDLSMPGKVLILLDQSAQFSINSIVTVASVHQAIEKTLNIKISTVNDDERDKLSNLEDLIHQKVIGQDHAVSSISDALRRSRAGVSSQDRPIGTFMFLGPTGVGKTELAKSLAEIYFDGADSIIRVDMNEFSGPSDNERLIQDGSTNSNSLTSRVMKQPFSVILFDEIEKAHSNTILTILQMLDEGILRDVNGREVSFRDSIIIATSNAGADRIREYIERGYNVSRFEDKFIDELLNSKIFKPEFVNRFDEIIIFKPLDKQELIKVVDIIIKNINKTLEVQKIVVTIDLDVKQLLIEKSYDPRLGARPIRRIIQRTVENIIAKKMLSGELVAGDVVNIGVEQIENLLVKENNTN